MHSERERGLENYNQLFQTLQLRRRLADTDGAFLHSARDVIISLLALTTSFAPNTSLCEYYHIYRISRVLQQYTNIVRIRVAPEYDPGRILHSLPKPTQ